MYNEGVRVRGEEVRAEKMESKRSFFSIFIFSSHPVAMSIKHSLNLVIIHLILPYDLNTNDYFLVVFATIFLSISKEIAHPIVKMCFHCSSAKGEKTRAKKRPEPTNLNIHVYFLSFLVMPNLNCYTLNEK